MSLSLFAYLVSSATLTGCASASKPATAPAPAEKGSDISAAKGSDTGELSQTEQMQRLRDKIVDLETRISALNEKMNLESGAVPKEIAKESARETLTKTAATPDASKETTELPTEAVRPSAAASKVVPTSKTSVKFVQDDNIDRYREAKIQYDSGRYADSTVEFVAFTKESPDHALAPAAQYFVGMGYLKQKEYGRAEEEFNRGLVAYPHSNYVPDTLLALLEIAIANNKAGRITYYQQKISSTFPHSPQATRAALLLNAPQTDGAREEKVAARPELIDRPSAPEAPEAPTTPKAAEGEKQ